MNYDVNMVEEIARLDAIHKGQRRLLYIAPFLAIFGLVVVFWLVPEIFSSFSLQFPSEEVQATEQATQSQRQSTATEVQATLMAPPTTAGQSTLVPSSTPVSTLDAVAATRESQAWAVQNAIRNR